GGEGGGAAGERLAEGPNHGLLGDGLGMAEGNAGAVDDEAVTACVHGAGHGYPLRHVSQIATRHDREPDARSLGQHREMMLDLSSEPGVPRLRYAAPACS